MKILFCTLQSLFLFPLGQKHSNRNQPIVSLLHQEIKKASIACSESTTINRTTAVNALNRFFQEKLDGGRHITLYTLNADHIKAFERWHLDRGLSPNYTACNMRNLRALISRLAGSEAGCQLFATVRTSNTPTVRRAVQQDTILKLHRMPLPEGSFDALARDIFIFCFKTMGMPLIDAAHLQKAQLTDGHITYHRHKTHRLARPVVEPQLMQTLNRLAPDNSPYLLPILSTSPSDNTRNQYKYFLRRYNLALSRLASRIGPECHLTSYTPRHTWASIANAVGVDLNTISQALTHSNANVTLSYIQGISDERIDEANKRVLEFMNN